jgi:hypothetical protein
VHRSRRCSRRSKDLEDENKPTDGASLMAVFRKIPFGWPDEIVRLLLAAALRGGAVYLELAGAQGTREIYDYTESGTTDLFTKVSSLAGGRGLAVLAARHGQKENPAPSGNRALNRCRSGSQRLAMACCGWAPLASREIVAHAGTRPALRRR